MKVAVTQECIDKGTRGAADDCPVAWGVREALGESAPPDVIIQYDRVLLGNAPQFQVVALPPEVPVFIDKYDRGFDVEPFEFEL